LSQIPVAAYTCDAMGHLTYFNSLAAAVWGRTATLRDSAQRFCGSYRMYSPDGAPVPHNECGMARALLEGRPYNGYEVVVIEQENGTRTPAVAYANPVRNPQGQVIGAVNLVIPKTSPDPVSASIGEHGRAVDGAALAITDVTLGLFAHFAWPSEAFS
jgi:two-component system sensor kinase FixL